MISNSAIATSTRSDGSDKTAPTAVIIAWKLVLAQFEIVVSMMAEFQEFLEVAEDQDTRCGNCGEIIHAELVYNDKMLEFSWWL